MRSPWREGFPDLALLDDKPVKGPNGRPIPPMRYSRDVLVALDDGAVRMDSAASVGGSEPFWRIYSRRVVAWAPLPLHPRHARA